MSQEWYDTRKLTSPSPSSMSHKLSERTSRRHPKGQPLRARTWGIEIDKPSTSKTGVGGGVTNLVIQPKTPQKRWPTRLTWSKRPWCNITADSKYISSRTNHRWCYFRRAVWLNKSFFFLQTIQHALIARSWDELLEEAQGIKDAVQRYGDRWDT